MSPDGDRLERLWSAAATRSPISLFRTADSGVTTPHGQVLVAVRNDGSRHLLVPIDPKHTLQEDLDGKAVTLRRNVLADESSYRVYAALGLVDDQFRDLFVALCVEIASRIAASPTRAVAMLRRALSDWRALLSGARRTLGPSELAGLFGELLVLRDMIGLDAGAVGFWTGHSGTAQDFQRGTIAIEVKTTTAAEGRTVRIHGLGQLDAGDSDRLLLTWFRLRTDQGRSVPDLVDEILGSTDDENAFLAALSKVGYLGADREVYARRIFDVVEQRTYEVGPGFPRIVPTGLAGDANLAGIAAIHYDLDLDSPPAAACQLDLDVTRSFLEHP